MWVHGGIGVRVDMKPPTEGGKNTAGSRTPKKDHPTGSLPASRGEVIPVSRGKGAGRRTGDTSCPTRQHQVRRGKRHYDSGFLKGVTRPKNGKSVQQLGSPLLRTDSPVNQTADDRAGEGEKVDLGGEVMPRKTSRTGKEVD